MDRTRCIGFPRCNRTFPVEKHGQGIEVICAQCLRLCPRERKFLRKMKRLLRHADRYPQKWSDDRRRRVEDDIDWVWAKIKHQLREIEQRPDGLDEFFQEMGW